MAGCDLVSLVRTVVAIGLLAVAPACTYQDIAPDDLESDQPERMPIPEPGNWEDLLPRQLEEVRAAVEPYRDFDTARKAGWKPFGGEEPLMGRHYYNDEAPDYVFGDPLNFSEPNNLMYAEVDGEMTLTGVAYVVRIGANEPLPPGFAGPKDVWHVHDFLAAINAATEDRPVVRTLAKWWLEDSYFSKGDYRHRLAMVHVWTETANPDGVFASYDRTLPYRKLGVPVEWSDGVSLETARGVNLGTESACDNQVDGIAWVGDLSRRQKRRLKAACETAGARVYAARQTSAYDLDRVATIAWQDYQAIYKDTVTPEQRRRIAAMTEHGDHHH